MKRHVIITVLVFACLTGSTQTLQQRIDKAVKQLQQTPPMKHALMSLYVVETTTGKPVFALNEQTGMAPASTQKIFTSIAAFEKLGKLYRYNTPVLYTGKIVDHVLYGDLVIKGSGDPTFGSWRFAQTKRDKIFADIITALNNAGIDSISGSIVIDNTAFAYQPLPGGWIWDDIGNYYGAGSWALNWNENQYDLLLKPGNKEGDQVTITGTSPALYNVHINNNLLSGKPGSGDNGYIYLSPYANNGFVEGTVPANEQQFKLSGAMPEPALQFGEALAGLLTKNNRGKNIQTSVLYNNGSGNANTLLTNLTSPALDSINYWFLQKSINLYGEALLKTMAYKESGIGATTKGVGLLQTFWNNKGIEKSALNIMDGSGLSPQNRVTTHALVTALQYARNKDWYSSFYAALPVYNGMHMKSGTIGGAKAYAGYHTAANGVAYTFAIIINNYDASAGSIVPKMFKILDELK